MLHQIKTIVRKQTVKNATKKSEKPSLPSEKFVHQQVCNYLKLQYPNIIFFSDPSGMRVSQGLRQELKKKRCRNYKIPDLIILSPNQQHKGLIIEIKRSREDVFKKDGSLKADDHVKEQSKSLEELTRLGYHAVFGCGFDEIRKIIDDYFLK